MTAHEISGSATVSGSKPRTHSKDRVRMGITTALCATYARLDADAQRLYRQLGLLPSDDVDPDMAAAACAIHEADAAWRLEVLADEQLLEPLADGGHPARPVRYRMSTAAREHACDLAAQQDSEQDRRDVRRRLCVWMLQIATHIQFRLTPAQATLRRTTEEPPAPVRLPFDDDAGALAWLDSHQHNLLGILRAAESAGWHDTLWRLTDAWWPHFHFRHPYTLWAAAHEMGLSAARCANNPAAQRQLLASGAVGLAGASRWDAAVDWYTQLLAAARDSADVRDEGQAHLGLGRCHLQAGRPQEAKEQLAHAIARWQQCGYRRGIGLTLIVLGETALAQGMPDEALAWLERAWTLLLDVNEPYEAARALVLLGHAHILLGQSATGITEMETALEIITATGSIPWQVRTWELLAAAHQAAGDCERALHCYRRSAELYDLIRPTHAERLRQLAQAR
ncbi:tetratricopeptide repeat protein [Streptomyces sp. NPDC058284]|uniref:tetratricopeptide repeat protein n=1 Tax=unclassified Streptomyces TaxID=2593676 RepID=UPI0036556D96